MKRVMVLGQAGAGKSTLALALGKITGLPVFHMDHVHWQPGWIEREREEKLRLVAEIIARDEWILEGGLSETYGERAARADTAVWLDLPLALRTARILKRRIRYRGGETRPDLPEDCPERLDPAFLSYNWRTRHSAREKVAQALADAPHLTVHHVRTAKGAETLLEWFRDDDQNHN